MASYTDAEILAAQDALMDILRAVADRPELFLTWSEGNHFNANTDIIRSEAQTMLAAYLDRVL